MFTTELEHWHAIHEKHKPAEKPMPQVNLIEPLDYNTLQNV